MSACRILVKIMERAPKVLENTLATVHISTTEPTAKVHSKHTKLNEIKKNV